MTDDALRKAATVMANAAAAMIKSAGMQATNQERLGRGEALAYGEEAFLSLVDEHCLNWNAIVEMLQP